MVERLKKSDGLYCINWTEAGIDLYGDPNVGDDFFSALDISAVPCHLKTNVGEHRDDCITDKTDVLDYFGAQNTFFTIAYYNGGKFNQDEFGEERVQKKSKLKRLHS